MAYSRMIHSNFFDSTDCAKYNEKEKYFLIGLVCSTDDFGKFWLNINRLKANIFSGNSRATTKWIIDTIQKFINDGVLCKYVDNEIEYCHFPNWFVKGWFLKQRIDKPRENIHPDCPICQTEKIARRKRELSRINKEKLNKEKIIKELAKNKNSTNLQHISNVLNSALLGRKK